MKYKAQTANIRLRKKELYIASTPFLMNTHIHIKWRFLSEVYYKRINEYFIYWRNRNTYLKILDIELEIVKKPYMFPYVWSDHSICK